MQGSFHVNTIICEKFCTVVHSLFCHDIYQTMSSMCGGRRSWQSQEASNILAPFDRRPRVMRVSYQTLVNVWSNTQFNLLTKNIKPLGHKAIGTLPAVFLPQSQKQPARCFLWIAMMMFR